MSGSKIAEMGTNYMYFSSSYTTFLTTIVKLEVTTSFQLLKWINSYNNFNYQ